MRDSTPGPAPTLTAAAESRCLARRHDQLHGKHVRNATPIARPGATFTTTQMLFTRRKLALPRRTAHQSPSSDLSRRGDMISSRERRGRRVERKVQYRQSHRVYVHGSWHKCADCPPDRHPSRLDFLVICRALRAIVRSCTSWHPQKVISN